MTFANVSPTSTALYRLLLGLALLIGFSLDASRAETFEEKYGKMVTDAAARESFNLAVSKIQTTKCGAAPCAPATPAEIANPPITIEDARVAMVTAIKSALAQWCGLTPLRSFLPAITAWDAKRKNNRQQQLFGLIHSDFMGRQLKAYSNAGQCPPTLREQLDTQLPKL
jgi:hypothetical protein